MRRYVVAFLVFVGCIRQGWASEVIAAKPAPPAMDWSMTLTKAATFEVLSSTLETGLFVVFYGGTATAAAGIFAVSITTASAVYILNEYVWEGLLTQESDRMDPAIIAGKTASYRAASTLRTFSLGSVFGSAEVAKSVGYAATVAVADSGLYAMTEWAMERARGKLPWDRKESEGAMAQAAKP